MYQELLTYIQTHDELVSESLRRCDIDTTLHKNDTLDELLDLAKKNINVFPFSDVKPCWFQLYANVCIAKTFYSLQNLDLSADIEGKGNDEIFAKAVASLDNALIIAGGGNEDTKNLVHEILRRLDRVLYHHDPYRNDDEDSDNLNDNDDDDEEFQAPPPKKRRLDTTSDINPPSESFPSNLAFVPKLNHPIPHLNAPSLTTFNSHILTTNTPLVLKNTLTHWPAFTKWHDPAYWLRRTLNGHRLVPIELGQSYTDEGWKQEIMSFGRFLDEYILKGDDAQEIGYLAQHDLFSQIPGLRTDFGVPDYCFADVPGKVDGGGKSKIKVDERDGIGLMGNGELLVHDNSLTTTNKGQNLAQPSAPTELGSTNNKETTTRSPLTPSYQNTSDHDHGQTQLAPSDHINPDINRRPYRDTSPSPSPPQSPSSSPPTIHQNIWFGTRTVTPLHHDPYSNILTQIHGTKYIRLYSPAYTALLYPRSAQEVAPHIGNQSDFPQSRDVGHDDGDSDQPLDNSSHENAQLQSRSEPPGSAPTIDMSNTSTIPLWSIEQSPYEDWDEQYPGFSSVPYVEGLLEAGDAVYIPKGWWHYVRGVSAVGIGISFWW